jgi:hypothetical protein
LTATPVSVTTFGGLNLADDALEVGPGAAVDLLNVAFDRRGALRVRPGYQAFNLSTLAASGYSALYGAPMNGGELLAVRFSSGGNVNVDKVDAGGTTTNVGSFAAAADTWSISGTTLGTTTATRLYFALFIRPGTGVTLRNYNGSVLGTGTGKPFYVATSARSNRLIQAGYAAAADSPSGANGDRSTVFWSDAGAPDTYTATSFVTLQPGDGENITAVVTWADLTYVFKQTAVYVFYNESTSSTGTPTFDYRRVPLQSRIIDPAGSVSSGARPAAPVAVAGPDGVYFVTIAGVYRIRSGTAELISAPIAKLFTTDDTVPAAIRMTTATGSSGGWLSWAAGKLLMGYVNANGVVRTLVYYPVTGDWTVWDLAAARFAEIPSDLAAPPDLSFWVGGTSSDNAIHDLRPTYTSDNNGTVIPFSYKSGKYPLAKPGEIAITKESRVFGTGTVTLTLSSEMYGDQTGSMALGTAPTPAEGWLQKDQEGQAFQHTVSGNGPATVEQVTHYVGSVRAA